MTINEIDLKLKFVETNLVVELRELDDFLSIVYTHIRKKARTK